MIQSSRFERLWGHPPLHRWPRTDTVSVLCRSLEANAFGVQLLDLGVGRAHQRYTAGLEHQPRRAEESKASRKGLMTT